MASDNASSVAGLAIRLTRLTSSGALAAGASGSYVTKKFVSLGFTPEYETGDEFTTKAADGSVCATWKAPDTLKRVTLSIAICDPDPEFTEMISGGTILSAGGGVSSGWASPKVGVDASPNGVAIEVWSYANVGGRAAATNPYWHWVFPYAQMHAAGERAIQNDMMAQSFEGWAVGNLGFGKGPASPNWAFPTSTDSPVSYARTTTIPVGTGYQTATITP
jgi:hypothetical protein